MYYTIIVYVLLRFFFFFILLLYTYTVAPALGVWENSGIDNLTEYEGCSAYYNTAVHRSRGSMGILEIKMKTRGDNTKVHICTYLYDYACANT